MAAVYTIGESLLDIIISHDGKAEMNVGGSMLNSAVSLARSGIIVHHLSECSEDMAGDKIMAFLKSNNIGRKYIARYHDGKTPIALAFLDHNKDARYSFYKQYPEKRMNIKIPDFEGTDILLFGSFFSLQASVRSRVLGIVKNAVSKKCLTVYDPNIRNPHKKDVSHLMKSIKENLELSDIVRASDQDFKNIFDTDTVNDAWSVCKKHHVSHLLYTMNKNGVYHVSEGFRRFYPAKEITPVSTIGAGDAFNAGLIKCIADSSGNTDWDVAIKTGIEYASKVCLSMNNYID